jgi:HlyD family type I secretion membrane fusion protein
MNELQPYHQQWFAQVPRSGAMQARIGYGVLAVWMVGFAAWGGTAPIEGAVVAPGLFVATTQNKIVQHLEGGIIRDILVREGERVEAGQALIRLDDTSARADAVRLEQRLAHLMAIQARLAAEATQQTNVTFPDELTRRASDHEVRTLLASQQSVFEARFKKLEKEVAIQQTTIAGLKFGIAGDTARIVSLQTQLALIEEELDGKAPLYQQGLVRKPDYLALQRTRANLQGELKRYHSDVGQSQERIATAEEQIARARNAAVQTALEELQTVAADFRDTRERLVAARSILGRLGIIAPVAGVVVKLHYHTPGGVIRPGNNILELLPVQDEQVIEINVRPQDIDNVKQGQEAVVRLTALNQRVTPMVSGKVAYVSADALPSDKKQSPDNVYIARIDIDPESTRAIKDFVPTPGMPAEVYVKTGQRTFFEYLLRPVRDTMTRAFREP